MSASSCLEVPDPTSRTTTRDSEESQHLRTQFLRRVAHDIASPTGVTLTVLDELASGDKPRPELVAMARRSLRRLMRLSEHLSIVAELEARSLEPELAVTDMRTLTKQAVDDAVAIDGRKEVVTACDLPTHVVLAEADSRLLLVVVREIIGNALRIASSRVEIGLTVRDGFVRIKVDDDGPGFSSDATEALGRRFVRRPATRGLGLSLSMATDILRAHDGDLSIEPSTLPPGRRGAVGSAVVVRLPAANAGGELTQRRAVTASSGG
jgi:two-component system, OmpR family, sensor kinase